MLFANACAYPRRRQVASIHRAAERDCLETPDSSGLRSYELSNRGTESPICPVGHQQNARLRPHSATFQTVSEGEFSETHIPDRGTLCVWTGVMLISSLCPGPIAPARLGRDVRHRLAGRCPTSLPFVGLASNVALRPGPEGRRTV
jgi:hypothetical protein